MNLTNRQNATDWFRDSKYGLFFHYLFNMDEMKNFNAEKFVSDVNKTGAGYVVLTLGQNSGFYCAPNPTYESLTGNAEGTKCYAGDVPMQAAKALEPYGIKLMLYLPSHPPSCDNNASTLLGLDQQIRPDWLMNDITAKNWSAVIRDWSEHYGKNISGWWFDGFYPWINMNNNYAKLYKEAILSGNSESILALNQGVEATVYPANEYCDYTAGEFNEFGALPTERFVDSAQWHVLSFLGKDWCSPAAKYDSNYLSNYISKANSKGGVVTVEMHIEPDGSFSEEQFGIMKRVKEQIRG